MSTLPIRLVVSVSLFMLLLLGLLDGNDGFAATLQNPDAEQVEEKKKPSREFPIRFWTSKAGEHKIKARFSELIDDSIVVLVKKDGTEIRVELSKLNELAGKKARQFQKMLEEDNAQAEMDVAEDREDENEDEAGQKDAEGEGNVARPARLGQRSDVETRRKWIDNAGGDEATEKSVDLALKWILSHQLQDGGWSFDHRIGVADRIGLTNSGTMTEARGAATAMALLPLLARGNTHKAGPFKEQVLAGLKFLMSRGKQEGRGLSYREPGGTMYSHGLVSMVFCEAYLMTGDRLLKPYAQGCISFIEDAQDPVGGGWRYLPQQAGDMSVTGWQLQALKTAELAKLTIQPQTIVRVKKFLASMTNDGGATFGYTEPPKRISRGDRARSAIGLLGQMYLAVDREAEGLSTGLKRLSEMGPDVGDRASAYYNYYANEVMLSHPDEQEWAKWNATQKAFLIASQQQDGPEVGSWVSDTSSHAVEKGGRLLCTSLSCLILESYYRTPPIYE